MKEEKVWARGLRQNTGLRQSTSQCLIPLTLKVQFHQRSNEGQICNIYPVEFMTPPDEMYHFIKA